MRTTKSYISPSLNDSAHLVHACSECRNYQFHFNLLTLFHKYYPHLGICSFGQINSTDTQRRSELWITTSTLKCNSEPQKHQDLLDQSLHYPCTSMVSFADSALRRAASLWKLSWDSQKDIVVWGETVLGFKHLSRSKTKIHKFHVSLDIYTFCQSSSLAQSM